MILARVRGAGARVRVAPGALAAGAASDWFVTDQGKVRLIAAQGFVGDDKAVELGLEFQLAPHWKIYWRSPGDAGYPPRLDWTGSENLRDSDARLAGAASASRCWGSRPWATRATVVLPIHATRGAARRAARAPCRARLSHLQRHLRSLPDDARARPAGARRWPGGYGALIAQALAARARATGAAAGLALAGATLRPGAGAGARARSPQRPAARAGPTPSSRVRDGVAFGAPQPRPGAAADETVLRLPVSGAATDVAALVGKPLTVTWSTARGRWTGQIVPRRGAAGASISPRLGPMLALALLGGLILNVMPCVLPVLSLKLLGAIEHGDGRGARCAPASSPPPSASCCRSSRWRWRPSARSRPGVAVGWGMQFQDPLFPRRHGGAAHALCRQSVGVLRGAVAAGRSPAWRRARPLGNIATGAFATLLATPCSAPFLGTALGFALAAGPGEIVAIFLALGVGFAVALSRGRGGAAAWRRSCRGRGAWMVAVRRAPRRGAGRDGAVADPRSLAAEAGSAARWCWRR